MWTLTDKQLAMIKRAAALLPSHAQPALLHSVANVLAAVEHAPRDGDVTAVLTLSSAQNAPALTAMALRGMRTAMGGSPNRRVGMLSGRPERMPEFGQRSRRVLTFG
jgi:hypothetical protein